MNSFENPAKTESVASPEKQELLKLEREGRYVFHGTDKDLEVLKPRQAVDTERGLDREPAIFASPAADFAIFHAIINGKNAHGVVSQSGAEHHDDGSYELKFALPKAALEQMPDSAKGYVYVFDKKDFAPIEGRPAEYESRTDVRPIQKIKVSKKDLPQNIEMIVNV